MKMKMNLRMFVIIYLLDCHDTALVCALVHDTEGTFADLGFEDEVVEVDLLHTVKEAVARQRVHLNLILIVILTITINNPKNKF